MKVDFLDLIPLWAMLGGTILLVFVATEVGFWAGQRRSKTAYENNEAQITSMTGAHLGLLAFFLAFSFGVAAGNFETRKKLVMSETNAIETAYLRTSLIADPRAKNIRALLKKYAGVRRDISRESAMAVLQISTEIHSEIWHEIEQVASSGQATIYHSLLVQAINEVFDLHEERLYAGAREVIPATLWVALYCVLILSMMGVGFHFGIKGARSPIPSAALALSFSVMLFLIADLDRAQSGILITNQEPMQDLYKRLDSYP